MKFDIIDFLEKNNIKYWTEGKNSSPGWVQIRCPFCEDESNHGGIHINQGNYNCWKCGSHPMIRVIQKLLNAPSREAYKIWRRHNKEISLRPRKRASRNLINRVKLPISCKKMGSNHRNYLLGRNFNPDYLESKYRLMGTEGIGNYKHRIIIPIFYQNRLVSYTGRDITDKQEERYKSCPSREAIMPIKETIYEIDNCLDSCVIVEGAIDQWRLGRGAISTFGIKVTYSQILQISKKFRKNIFILFDPEAQEAAQRLGNILENVSGPEARIEILSLEGKGDPASLSDEEAKYLMKELKLV